MQVKFLQINIWLGGRIWGSLIDFIKKENPDIITAQEIYSNRGENNGNNLYTFSDLQKMLQYPHTNFVPEFIHIRGEGRLEQGNAVFSKLPLVDSSSRYFVGSFGEFDESIQRVGDEPRNLQHVTLDIGGKHVDVFNVHGIVDNRGEYDSPDRLEMSRVIVEEIGGKENVILSGDFNVKPNTKTIGNIEKHLTNVFKDELTTTFNMRHKDNPGFATAVVDMIFVSKSIKVLEHHCPRVDVSDHYPLVAVLGI